MNSVQNGSCPARLTEVGHADIPDFLLWQSEGLLVPTWTAAWVAVEIESVRAIVSEDGVGRAVLPSLLTVTLQSGISDTTKTK